ncbi:hypothetical protein DM02DRAFT_620095 [Periconia macrospinosa]|uniref:Uncharacterized protein n=1 Tax=Periconia macrospinosa TaxID=97972 RepID=A0A2V1D3X7_9PLEO|nr:hypothetical protein DM02DRAFT_620095 [Periconia macrospinosa]
MEDNLHIGYTVQNDLNDTEDRQLPSSTARKSWRSPSSNSLNATMKSRREQEALVIALVGIESSKLDKSYAVRPPMKRTPFSYSMQS